MHFESRIQTFATPKPIRLRVDLPKGRIRVIAGATGETRVELTAIHGDATALDWIDDAIVAQSGDEVVVLIRKSGFRLFDLGGGVEAVVHVPADSAVRLSTGSGRIESEGRLGEVHAQSGSGVVRLEDCGETHARTGSGEITIASSTASVDARTGSGRIAVGKVALDACIVTGSGHAELEEVGGDAKLTTASGNIEIGQAGDRLEAFAASGSVQVRRADHGLVRAKTISGRICVGVADGAAALLDISTMSGRVSSELDSSEPPADGEKQVELVISTMSGNVKVARA